MREDIHETRATIPEAGSGRQALLEQLHRIPMDRALREVTDAGTMRTPDADAARSAAELKEALDSLPEIVESLRAAMRHAQITEALDAINPS